MKKEIVTIKVYEKDRNKLERVKRDIKSKSFQDTLKRIFELITFHKLWGELK